MSFTKKKRTEVNPHEKKIIQPVREGKDPRQETARRNEKQTFKVTADAKKSKRKS